MPKLTMAGAFAAPALALAAVGLAHPDQLSIVNAGRWYAVHVLLLVLFPLLVVPLVVLVRDESIHLRTAVTTLAFFYAVFYGTQDAIAGVGLGAVMKETTDPEKITALQPTATMLFDEGNAMARVGLWCFLAAAFATSAALLWRRRVRALPGALLLLGGGVSFLDSHVYWPRGVITMVVIAGGLAALAWVVAEQPPALAQRLRPPRPIQNRQKRARSAAR